MVRGILPALVVLAVAVIPACVDRGPALLEQELSLYRSEQEKVRREDLEQRYAKERVRCDELTEKILALRSDVEGKEAELAELRVRLESLAREIAAANASLSGAGTAVKPD